MDINNVSCCSICGHMFRYAGFGPRLCPVCREADDKDFEKVKNYLRDNPGRTLVQTAEDCGVSIERIRYWLREERLEFSGEGGTGLICEHCGKPITTGKLCDGCRQANLKAAGEMARSIASPVREKPVITHKGDRMRFLGSR